MNIYKDPYQKFERLSLREFRGTEGIEVKLINSPSDPYLDIFCAQQMSWRNNFEWGKDAESVLSEMKNNKDSIVELINDIKNNKIWASNCQNTHRRSIYARVWQRRSLAQSTIRHPVDNLARRISTQKLC